MTRFPQLDAFRRNTGVVRLIGHRGARGILPENTMQGFEFTVGIGVNVLEFDVVLTRDKIPVITHNHHLSSAATRTADGKWLLGPEPKVANMTFAEIRALDVGGLDGRTEYGQRFPDQAFLSGVPTPSLAELLDFSARPENSGLHLLLELKSDPYVDDVESAQQDIVAAVLNEIRKRSLQSRTVLHSFDWRLLDECRRQAPEMPTSYLSELPENDADPGEDSSMLVAPDFARMQVSIPQAVSNAGGQMWCPYYKDVTTALVAEAHALDLLVTVWTVNERPDIVAMIDAGVDGIVTDYPGRVQRCLLQRGLSWTS